MKLGEKVAVVKTAVVIIALAGVVIACNRASSSRPTDFRANSSAVTPVEGPSWLKHLGLSLVDTRLGQMGGIGAAPSTARREPPLAKRQAAEALTQTFDLTGADLYRVNCRSCHGPEGNGAPPEIHSLIGPVQGTSAGVIERRMQERGAPISSEMATQMAGQAEKLIRDRLQHGGEKMPPFAHLHPEEVEALLRYLRHMAGISGRDSNPPVKESSAHVGEEVIKGTCHVCHDATGPGGSRMTIMMRGIIPSLASLPIDHSADEVMEQVHYGTRMMMMMMRGGNRMPPFPYFTDEEIAAAYLYLQSSPPAN